MLQQDDDDQRPKEEQKGEGEDGDESEFPAFPKPAPARGSTAQTSQAGATTASTNALRVRLHIIRNERIENVGKSQSCMISKLRIICKQIVDSGGSVATLALKAALQVDDNSKGASPTQSHSDMNRRGLLVEMSYDLICLGGGGRLWAVSDGK